ncbi:hypothetical protein Cgig2_032103 [Carnegiea gigantea]|uniref:Uncharacterized protein n=1 Tax=Carnegiea gigantea TaxID=171969 RepID=A0A9Q1GQA8_9CARY|nr:hypothetical protein Cgig2_032103 [Carnegiea gigantea]
MPTVEVANVDVSAVERGDGDGDANPCSKTNVWTAEVGSPIEEDSGSWTEKEAIVASNGGTVKKPPFIDIYGAQSMRPCPGITPYSCVTPPYSLDVGKYLPVAFIKSEVALLMTVTGKHFKLKDSNMFQDEAAWMHVFVNFVKGLIYAVSKHGVGDDVGKYCS